MTDHFTFVLHCCMLCPVIPFTNPWCCVLLQLLTLLQLAGGASDLASSLAELSRSLASNRPEEEVVAIPTID